MVTGVMIDRSVKLEGRQEQTGVSHRALSPDKELWHRASIRCLLYPAFRTPLPFVVSG